MGKPRVAGTRITVELILKEMAADLALEVLLRAYPQLRREDIQAVVTYVPRPSRHEEVRSLPEAVG